jgi:hypothetical protein
VGHSTRSGLTTTCVCVPGYVRLDAAFVRLVGEQALPVCGYLWLGHEMGFFQRLFGALGMSSKACKILVVGLDDAGKTTIMNQIMPKKVRAD